MVLPGGEDHERPGIRHVSGATVQKQQHRVGAVLSADGDPLLDAADGDVVCLVNSFLAIDRELLRIALAQKRYQRVEFAILLIKWIGFFDVY